MRSHLIVGLSLLWALAPATLATNADEPAPRHQTSMVTFERPTWVTNQLLMGMYVIVHDEDKMARDEACTTLFRVGTRTRPLEEVVSFHCIPRQRHVVPSFTITLSSNPALGSDTLTEYQFAGDSEGHGVPSVMRTSNPLANQGPTVCVE